MILKWKIEHFQLKMEFAIKTNVSTFEGYVNNDS